jgi:hypothetical protein
MQQNAGNQAVQRFLSANLSRESPATSGPDTSPRRCSCGGSCANCARDENSPNTAAPHAPLRKSLDSETDDEQELLNGPSRGKERKGQPRNGAATIVCDGAGGYRVQLNSWAGYPCGIEACIRKHEMSHAADWKVRWPDGCKNKRDGDAIPLGGPGYAAFLKQSECDAYTIEVPCEEAALAAATGDCKAKVQTVLDDTKQQKANFC